VGGIEKRFYAKNYIFYKPFFFSSHLMKKNIIKVIYFLTFGQSLCFFRVERDWRLVELERRNRESRDVADVLHECIGYPATESFNLGG